MISILDSMIIIKHCHPKNIEKSMKTMNHSIAKHIHSHSNNVITMNGTSVHLFADAAAAAASAACSG